MKLVAFSADRANHAPGARIIDGAGNECVEIVEKKPMEAY